MPFRDLRLVPLLLFVAGTFALTAPPDAGVRAHRPAGDEAPVFDARAAEHLLSRVGFGATEAQVQAAVEVGLEATLARLFAGDPTPREPWTERLVGLRETSRELRELPRAERQKRNRELRRRDASQLARWRAWWVGRMLRGDDPLRERMTLFWHGHFPSAMGDVRNGHELIVQNRLLREYALGNVRELTRRVARDAAMLEYLDNDENRKRRPNENFARELLELFTLGEGYFTEADVAAVARAFTGWTDADGRFVLRRGRHDSGRKTILGATAGFGGDEVIALLFEQPRCARFLAERLLTHFEGRPPGEARAERYAELLARVDFELEPFLGTLFRDPDFYRTEVVGTRVASPLEFLIGSALRLGVEPPPDWIEGAARTLGQTLFEPPTVEGWPDGPSWITTASLMGRGNLAGVLAGAMEPADLARMAAGERMPASRLEPELRRLVETDWRARPNLGRVLATRGARLDGQLVRGLVAELLAVPVAEDTLKELVRALRPEREALGLADGELLDHPAEAEPVLRRLAHLILSLPEAQLL